MKMAISQKLRIVQKKLYARNERQINFNLPCKFGHFWRKLNLMASKTPLLDARDAQTRYDLIWNFTPIFIFSSLHIFYVKMVTSDEGRRVYISLVWKQPTIIHYYQNLHYQNNYMNLKNKYQSSHINIIKIK